MKTTKTNLIMLVFFSCLSVLASDVQKLPLDDQLKLVKKIEFGKLDTGIGETFNVPFGFPFRNCQAVGSLIIEVDDLKLDTCLKAVQARIKAGYDPNYPGDFDNSFLNELMIGVLDQHEDHARRKIAFKLKISIKDPDVSLPDDVLQTRNVMICDVGLSHNHRYVGLNFWQEFVGGRELSDVAACFFLIDHKGNVLWRQDTNEISDPNWEEYKQKMRITQMSELEKLNEGRIRGIFWYPGAVRDKEPVQSFIVSNEGHVLTYHKFFGLWLDKAWPKQLILRDRDGKTIYRKEGGAYNYETPAFDSDSTRLRFIDQGNLYKKEQTFCIDTKTGKELLDSNPCFSEKTIKPAYSVQTQQSVITREPERIHAEWTVRILNQSGKKVAETKVPLDLQVSKEFEFRESYYVDYYFGAKSLIDEKTGRFFVMSSVGFLEFQFSPLSSSEGNG